MKVSPRISADLESNGSRLEKDNGGTQENGLGFTGEGVRAGVFGKIEKSEDMMKEYYSFENKGSVGGKEQLETLEK